jgi:chemotaxis protein MotB
MLALSRLSAPPEPVMAANTKIIVKRKRGGKAEGHHGGAWKVAYADFVTAMMAFFLMMWLLNATTVDQKKGLADYFDSKVQIFRVQGGGSGAFGGESLTEVNREGLSGASGETIAAGTAESEGDLSDDPDGASDEASDKPGLADVARSIEALTGSGVVSDEIMQHLGATITDEGLVIDIFDTAGQPLFDAGSAEPTIMRRATSARWLDKAQLPSTPSTS